MFDLSEQLFDNIKDDVRPLLNSLDKRTRWNAEAKQSLINLIELLKKKKYISFTGHPNRYHLTRIGSSCLYDVPTYRKGALAPFRGKRVRLVCISSGRYDRQLMAGVVGDTPKNKLKVKEKPTYVFPDIGDHEIEYLGRRFMVIKSVGEDPIEFYQGSFDSIDLSDCDFILLDGKVSCPIATFKLVTNGQIFGRLVGRTWGEHFFTIPEAVKGMSIKNQRFGNAILK
jgi:hypothetical protein